MLLILAQASVLDPPRLARLTGTPQAFIRVQNSGSVFKSSFWYFKSVSAHFFCFGLLATGKSKSTPFHCTNNLHYQNLALLPLVKRARVRTHTADAI